MNLVGVRFLLNYSHVLMIAVTDAVARRIVSDWKAGRFPPIVSSEEYPPAELAWAVQTSQIICVHMVQMEQQPGQGTMPSPGGRWNSSGLSGGN